MSNIYITGHRNPDMDSVCAAWSYAQFKNLTDPENTYIPVRCGHLSDSLKKQLEFVRFVPPPYMKDVYPKAGDVMRRNTLTIDSNAPIFDLIRLYDNTRMGSIVPVLKNGDFYGLLSVDDMTAWFLADNKELQPEYEILVENVGKVLPGKMIKKGSKDTLKVSILAGAAAFYDFVKIVEEQPDCMIVMGSRKEHLAQAAKMNIPAIIISASETTPDVDFSDFNGFIYQTTLPTAEAIRRLRMAPAISTIMGKQAAPVQTTDFFEDVKEALAQSRFRGFPVFDKEKWVGFVTRRCFLDRPSYNVILVDHNEEGQSIRGLETATIREIIDHHRLDAPTTDTPIFIDAEPLGSTCTIIYQNYLRKGLTPDPKTAKVLLTGVICDTLVLRSPTTTVVDEVSARELAKLCGVEDIKQFGTTLFSFSESLSVRDPQRVINSDFKMYNEKGVKFGVGQCEVPFLTDLDSYREMYLEAIEKQKTSNGLDWAMLMVTDVLRGNSVLLCSASKYEKKLSYRALADRTYDMPEILSRKKQLLPEILHTID